MKIILVLGVILTKIVYNTYASAHALVEREQAFWLAEAGLEKGKVELKHNPAWYTDLPHYPEDDVSWLKAGAVGQKERLGEGWFKVVREKDKDRFYSVGIKGKAVVVLKLKNSIWEEI